MESDVVVFQFSLRKVIEKFGFWFVRSMDHSGIPLYLILHPEEIEVLSDAEPVGLEVNLPTGIDVWMSRDDSDKGRKRPKVDLIFSKKGYYYLVEVKDKQYISPKDKADVEEYARRFIERFNPSEKF